MMRPVVYLALVGAVLPLVTAAPAIAAPAASDDFITPEVIITNLANTVTRAYAAREALREARAQSEAPLSLPAAIFADLASVFEPMLPADALEELVRWRCNVRDALHATDVPATEHLAAFEFGTMPATKFKLPDLSVLTRFPLPQSQRSWQTSGFGWRDDPYRHRSKFHAGADVRAESGTPVFAAGDGVVSFAGRMSGYGNLVMVDHGGGVITRYAHLRSILTKKGAVLMAGSPLGLVGRTGHATGNHLHFEVRLDERPVSPTLALTVGEMQRDHDAQAELAAFGLDPDRQMHALSDLDPPKKHSPKKATPAGSRPDRPGRTKRVKPTS